MSGGVAIAGYKKLFDAIKTHVDAIRVQIEMMQQMESLYIQKMVQD